MASTKNIKVADLKLDLSNYRTIHKKNEKGAIDALITINPEWFWALMNSLIEDGYSPTENIIVLDTGGSLVVKVASLKLILGLVKNIEIPDDIQEKITKLPVDWKTKNASVPCAVYPLKDKAYVDKLVSRTHAKDERAGRDNWTSVARARYGRDQNQKTEPGLDLLEKYIENGRNLTTNQAERWAGDYPLTVLDESIKKLAPLLNVKNAVDLLALYPRKNKRVIDKILFDIGTSQLSFKQLRAKQPFWGTAYGLTDPNAFGGKDSSDTGGADAKISKPTQPVHSGKEVALSSNDPNAVRRMLRQFQVRGKGREKIVALVDEISSLRLEKHPHAFCFVLRSIFELSAKAYCKDHERTNGPRITKKDGHDKNLADLLREITNHLTKNKKDKGKLKRLHGAMTELAKKNGILSITSMNQLVHNQYFSVSPPDICILFGNIFPLLEDMNS